jgi:hypothetical protein
MSAELSILIGVLWLASSFRDLLTLSFFSPHPPPPPRLQRWILSQSVVKAKGLDHAIEIFWKVFNVI